MPKPAQFSSKRYVRVETNAVAAQNKDCFARRRAGGDRAVALVSTCISSRRPRRQQDESTHTHDEDDTLQMIMMRGTQAKNRRTIMLWFDWRRRSLWHQRDTMIR
jgi:hypothetical protein